MIATRQSFLISSENPDKLSSFYSSLFGLIRSDGFTEKDYSLSSASPATISIFKPSTKQETSRCKTPSLALCFTLEPSLDPVSRINLLIRELLNKGAEVIEKPRLESFGSEAWFYDIDKNKFLIVAPFLKSKN